MTEKSLFSSHGIKDNHSRGKVADFLDRSQLNWGYYEVQPHMLESLPIPAAINEQIAVIECNVEAVTAGTRRPDYERLLNGFFYELFFPENLHARNIRLFDACAAAGIRTDMNAQAVAAQLARLQTLADLRLIENQPPAQEPVPVSEPNQSLAQAA